MNAHKEELKNDPKAKEGLCQKRTLKAEAGRSKSKKKQAKADAKAKKEQVKS